MYVMLTLANILSIIWHAVSSLGTQVPGQNKQVRSHKWQVLSHIAPYTKFNAKVIICGCLYTLQMFVELYSGVKVKFFDRVESWVNKIVTWVQI